MCDYGFSKKCANACEKYVSVKMHDNNKMIVQTLHLILLSK
jgi:hypothetical protein